MSDLKSIVQELSENKKAIEAEILGDLTTRPGRLMRQQDAIRAQPELEAKYLKAFDQTVVLAFVSGTADQQNSLSEAAKELGAMVVDGEECYRLLADRTRQTMSIANLFASAQYNAIVKELSDYGRATGEEFEISLSAMDNVEINSDSQLHAVVKGIVELANGKKLQQSYLKGAVHKTALAEKIKDKVTVVLVKNVPETEQDWLGKTLFRSKYIKHTVAKEPESYNSEALKMFNDIKKYLKGS